MSYATSFFSLAYQVLDSLWVRASMQLTVFAVHFSHSGKKSSKMNEKIRYSIKAFFLWSRLMTSAVTMSYARPGNLYISILSSRFEEDLEVWVQNLRRCGMWCSWQRNSCSSEHLIGFHLFLSLCKAPLFLMLQVTLQQNGFSLRRSTMNKNECCIHFFQIL